MTDYICTLSEEKQNAIAKWLEGNGVHIPGGSLMDYIAFDFWVSLVIAFGYVIALGIRKGWLK